MGESGHQLLNEESQKSTTDRGQVEVVDHEQSVQLVCRAVTHQLSASKNDNIVDNDGNSTLLQRRHGRDHWPEIKILGMIALDSREGLVEERP